MDLYIIEHEDQHTEECLKYAGKFGKRYCIAQCLDARRAAAQQSVQADECLCSSDRKHYFKFYTMGHVELCEWCGTRR